MQIYDRKHRGTHTLAHPHADTHTHIHTTPSEDWKSWRRRIIARLVLRLVLPNSQCPSDAIAKFMNAHSGVRRWVGRRRRRNASNKDKEGQRERWEGEMGGKEQLYICACELSVASVFRCRCRIKKKQKKTEKSPTEISAQHA